MIAYLDTHVALWLAEGRTRKVSSRGLESIEESEALLSPMALLELEYMHEVRRSKLRAQDVLIKLKHEIGLRICDLPFADVATAACDEGWTRDPFDRMIVAQAKVNGLAPLISADVEIAKHYPRTIW